MHLCSSFAAAQRATTQSRRSQSRKPDHRHAERKSAATGSADPADSRLLSSKARRARKHSTVICNRETISGPTENRVSICEGNVDARIGTYRLQADKVTVYDATNKVVAEGNVVFDQGDQQRITGSHAEWNYRTKTGFFLNSTGYTNQTQDGTRMYFTADRVEKVNLTTIVVINGEITACDEEVPKWSFRAKRATIKTGDRVRIKSASFRIKRFPVIYHAVRVDLNQASRSLFRIPDTDVQRFGRERLSHF